MDEDDDDEDDNDNDSGAACAGRSRWWRPLEVSLESDSISMPLSFWELSYPSRSALVTVASTAR